MLITRILTASILLPLLLLAIYQLPSLYFSLVTAAIILWCAWEWSGFIGYTHYFFRVMYVTIIAFALFLATFLHPVVVLDVGLFSWIWIAGGIILYQQQKLPLGFQLPLARAFAGFFVLTASWVAIVTLRSYANVGPHVLVFVLGIIFAADIGAYFSGRLFGRHALVSIVSPKKTWEGFVGGLIFSLLIAAIGGLFLDPFRQHYLILLELAFLTAFFSVIGDLGVSLMKRISGLKDSGHGIPGHGGILDRMDSVAAGTVVFALGVLLRF